MKNKAVKYQSTISDLLSMNISFCKESLHSEGQEHAFPTSTKQHTAAAPHSDYKTGIFKMWSLDQQH